MLSILAGTKKRAHALYQRASKEQRAHRERAPREKTHAGGMHREDEEGGGGGGEEPEEVSMPVGGFKQGGIDAEWVAKLTARLVWGTKCVEAAKFTKVVMQEQLVVALLNAAHTLLKREPCVVDVASTNGAGKTQVVVVGDTHGQFHDVLRVLEMAPGMPSSSCQFVWNGDFVDRGSWGLESMLVLLAWKLAAPDSVYLLRGNHETKYCSMMYGFKGELEAKFGTSMGSFDKPKGMWMAFLRIFASLPLAAAIGDGAALVLHGGLFRAPQDSKRAQEEEAAGTHRRKKKKPKKKKRARDEDEEMGEEVEPGTVIRSARVGTIDELRAAGKGGEDPLPDYMTSASDKSRMAADVLWSDPGGQPGFRASDRGIGCVHGPDILREFARLHPSLKLVVRSHEGPDAREEGTETDRARGFSSLHSGFSVDQEEPGGARLVTVFSAPSYPQHEPGADNRASIVVLSGPHFGTEYDVITYDAAPRPEARCYYELDDEDLATTEPEGAACWIDSGDEVEVP